MVKRKKGHFRKLEKKKGNRKKASAKLGALEKSLGLRPSKEKRECPRKKTFPEDRE